MSTRPTSHEAIAGLAKVGAMLALTVEDVLAPALRNRRVQSCLHILDDILNQRDGYARIDRRLQSDKYRVFICPFHRERLICNLCLVTHFEHAHTDEHATAGCFVCGTGPLRTDFEPVVAQIQLHKPVPFYDDNRGRGRFFTHSGELWTLPVTYLCPEHARLVELPWRMGWPMTAEGVSPEDVTSGR